MGWQFLPGCCCPEECTECTDCTGCAPEQYQVTLDGLVSWPLDPYGYHCQSCENLNGTYILTKEVNTICRWSYEAPVIFCQTGPYETIHITLDFLFVDPATWYVRLLIAGYTSSGELSSASNYFLLEWPEKPPCSLPPDEGEEDLVIPVFSPLQDPLPAPPYRTDCDWRVATARIKPLTA